MSGASYAYKYRPYYFDPEKGLRGKLLEFYRRKNAEQFFKVFMEAIGQLEPNLGDAEEMWMVDETRYELKTKMGNVAFMINAYDFIHLEGKNNILDEIEKILNEHQEFEQLEVFERDYILKNKK